MATSELIIEQLQIGPMQNFVYVVGSRATREVVLVDPAWDIDALTAHLAENDYRLPTGARDALPPRSRRRQLAVADRRPGGTRWQRSTHTATKRRRSDRRFENDLVRSDWAQNQSRIEVKFLHTPVTMPGLQCFRTETRWYPRYVVHSGMRARRSTGPDPEQINTVRNRGVADDTRCVAATTTAAPNATDGETSAQNPYLRIDDLVRGSDGPTDPVRRNCSRASRPPTSSRWRRSTWSPASRPRCGRTSCTDVAAHL